MGPLVIHFVGMIITSCLLSLEKVNQAVFENLRELVSVEESDKASIDLTLTYFWLFYLPFQIKREKSIFQCCYSEAASPLIRIFGRRHNEVKTCVIRIQ